MKIFKLTSGTVLLFLSIISCTPDREIDFTTIVHPPIEIDSAVVVINEFVAKGSLNANEFGTNEDWFEIYNPHADSFRLEEGKWFATNDRMEPTKSPIPARVIPPHGFLVIWCDEADTIPGAQDVHVNFKLSSTGEEFGIFYSDSTTSQCIDFQTFGPQNESAVSHGRMPDGSQNWIIFNLPTPGNPNQ